MLRSALKTMPTQEMDAEEAGSFAAGVGCTLKVCDVAAMYDCRDVSLQLNVKALLDDTVRLWNAAQDVSNATGCR